MKNNKLTMKKQQFIDEFLHLDKTPLSKDESLIISKLIIGTYGDDKRDPESIAKAKVKLSQQAKIKTIFENKKIRIDENLAIFLRVHAECGPLDVDFKIIEIYAEFIRYYIDVNYEQEEFELDFCQFMYDILFADCMVHKGALFNWYSKFNTL